MNHFRKLLATELNKLPKEEQVEALRLFTCLLNVRETNTEMDKEKVAEIILFRLEWYPNLLKMPF